jgi:hypothetical protein
MTWILPNEKLAPHSGGIVNVLAQLWYLAGILRWVGRLQRKQRCDPDALHASPNEIVWFNAHLGAWSCWSTI